MRRNPHGYALLPAGNINFNTGKWNDGYDNILEDRDSSLIIVADKWRLNGHEVSKDTPNAEPSYKALMTAGGGFGHVAGDVIHSFHDQTWTPNRTAYVYGVFPGTAAGLAEAKKLTKRNSIPVRVFK